MGGVPWKIRKRAKITEAALISPQRDPLVRSSGLEQAWLSPDLFLGQKTPDAGRSAGLPGLESVLPRPALVKASKPARNPIHSGLVKRLVRKRSCRNRNCEAPYPQVRTNPVEQMWPLLDPYPGTSFFFKEFYYCPICLSL